MKFRRKQTNTDARQSEQVNDILGCWAEKCLLLKLKAMQKQFRKYFWPRIGCIIRFHNLVEPDGVGSTALAIALRLSRKKLAILKLV